MPDKTTIERARKDRRQGKAPSTQAGEFVREEIEKIRRGEHGARSPEQAIAIGLSMARRAGVPLRPPRKGRVKERTRRSAQYAYEAGQHKRRPKRRPRVARAVERALEREPRNTVSRSALSRHAKRGIAAEWERPLGGGAQGGAHENPPRPLGSGKEGGAYARAAPPVRPFPGAPASISRLSHCACASCAAVTT